MAGHVEEKYPVPGELQVLKTCAMTTDTIKYKVRILILEISRKDFTKL